MSTWSEGLVRSTVLKGGATAVARPARMDAELSTTAFAPQHRVDARLTDPFLQGVVERARQAAVQEGHAQGHAQGYAAGLATAAAEAAVQGAATQLTVERAERERDAQVQRALTVLTAVAQQFQRAEQVSVAEIEDTVAELALEIARAVLDRELRTSADPGREAVARALVLAPPDCPLTVRLHPDELNAVSDTAGLAAGREIVFVADVTVERGGCVLEGAGRTVDAQVGPALARVAAALR